MQKEFFFLRSFNSRLAIEFINRVLMPGIQQNFKDAIPNSAMVIGINSRTLNSFPPDFAIEFTWQFESATKKGFIEEYLTSYGKGAELGIFVETPNSQHNYYDPVLYVNTVTCEEASDAEYGWAFGELSMAEVKKEVTQFIQIIGLTEHNKYEEQFEASQRAGENAEREFRDWQSKQIPNEPIDLTDYGPEEGGWSLKDLSSND